MRELHLHWLHDQRYSIHLNATYVQTQLEPFVLGPPTFVTTALFDVAVAGCAGSMQLLQTHRSVADLRVC